MLNLGILLKEHIEKHNLKKSEVARQLNISRNYMSTLFSKQTMDISLWERICNVIGLDPCVAFGPTKSTSGTTYNGINASALLGQASVNIGENGYKELLAEKERTIQILLQQLGLKSGQICDNVN